MDSVIDCIESKKTQPTAEQKNELDKKYIEFQISCAEIGTTIETYFDKSLHIKWDDFFKLKMKGFYQYTKQQTEDPNNFNIERWHYEEQDIFNEMIKDNTGN